MLISLRPRLLAAAVSVCFTAPAAFAQVTEAPAPIVITGARFDADPALAPIGATVITADEIRRAGYEKSLNSGIVLTGGGSILEGMPEIAEQIFDLPIRRGSPVGIGGMADHVNSPTFGTPVGLALYAHRNRAPDAARGGGGALGRVAVRLRGIFKEFF